MCVFCYFCVSLTRLIVVYNNIEKRTNKKQNIFRYIDIDLTRSDLEWKRYCKIFVPTAPFGGSSKAVNANVDSRTFKSV
jgi:hypothetical protein